MKNTRIWHRHWVWLKTLLFRWTHWLISTRRALGLETYTTRWNQNHWGKSKMDECFEERTWHQAGGDCSMRALLTGKLLQAGSKVWYDIVMIYNLVVVSRLKVLLCWFFTSLENESAEPPTAEDVICDLCASRYSCSVALWCAAPSARERSEICICHSGEWC